ncbi:hypothetical protein AGOR_G00016280 [Albula goreensis]|uniref:Methyltransferase domain-containing protein n=1 Tax=Albula goreensis TaxID=1534307 RepID=A0A8T3EAB2_9TELE|nr:hypothetical protein AGOR_G00016280 [Albula goreensis]
MSRLESVDFPLELIKRKIEEIKDFLKISLSIANAHTVDFYTRNVWDQFMAVPPESVLSIISNDCGQEMAPESLETQRCEGTAETGRTNFGFCCDSKRLVDVAALQDAAKRHALPGLGVCVPLSKLLQGLREHDGVQRSTKDEVLEPEEFMNSKKSHEVQIMSELVSTLAKCCQVQQVIDVGSGKGYLCSFLSLRYGLKVYGIDSSSTNTHSAQERNRKLKKYSKAYQRHGKTRLPAGSREGEQKMEGVEEQTTGESERSEQKEHQQEESSHFQQSGEEEGEEMRMKERAAFPGSDQAKTKTPSCRQLSLSPSP